MRIDTHKHYDKAWAKLTRKQQLRVLSALKIFIEAPRSPALRVHKLKGEYFPHFSISAGGDLRIHYLVTDEKRIVLTAVGTHGQLYD